MINKYWFLSGFLLALLVVYQLNLVAIGYNIVRPLFLGDGGDNCLSLLTAKSVQYRSLGTIREKYCVVKNAVYIINYPKTELSSPITLSCHTANKLGDFFDKIIATSITHMGSYNCRTIRQTGFVSEHGFGTAIDISMINGASVEKHWGVETKQGNILARADQSARDYFSNVLTPATDKAHRDHFHLDDGLGF